ncbi:Cys-tRNA(Pro) deacylase [Coriobacteriales bacterium OH1046]|nr:Cys-tRNA(Pro) deacylase [Coriobacteriales bacterium OH1046]
MARGARIAKTNALRELDAAGIAYTAETYPADDGMPARDYGVHVAELLGHDPASSFKTLVAVTPHGDPVVCCIPAAAELDLKKAAAAAGEKSLALLHVRDLEPVCGYARGACSPIGMRKRFPTLIDETALLFDEMGISGGRRGLALRLSPDDVVSFLDATLSDICREEV